MLKILASVDCFSTLAGCYVQKLKVLRKLTRVNSCTQLAFDEAWVPVKQDIVQLEHS